MMGKDRIARRKPVNPGPCSYHPTAVSKYAQEFVEDCLLGVRLP